MGQFMGADDLTEFPVSSARLLLVKKVAKGWPKMCPK